MNPWKCQKWLDFYSHENVVRSGLRIHYCKNINNKLRMVFSDFVKWLRRNKFPMRVNVYLKETKYVKALDGESVSATFFGPYDRIQEPYIKISVGGYNDLVARQDEFNALCSNIASLAHELTHYFQWLNDFSLSQEQEERQARYYAKK